MAPKGHFSGTSRATPDLVRVVYDALDALEERLPGCPDPLRIELRVLKERLRRAYPHVTAIQHPTVSDVAQLVAEEDGEEI